MPTDETTWTLFISHSATDKRVARRIRDALQSRGVSVWLDEAEIRVGDSIPEAVQAGLERSDALALLVSESSARSRWVAREFNSFVVRMIQADKPVFPCRLDDTDVPSLIADLRYADFRGSVDEGVEQLLGARHLAQEAETGRRAIVEAEHIIQHFGRDATLWSVHFLGRGSYHVGDRRVEPHPFQLLHELKARGLADYEPDRYEQAWFVTPLGRRVYSLLRRMVRSE